MVRRETWRPPADRQTTFSRTLRCSLANIPTCAACARKNSWADNSRPRLCCTQCMLMICRKWCWDDGIFTQPSAPDSSLTARPANGVDAAHTFVTVAGWLVPVCRWTPVTEPVTLTRYRVINGGAGQSHIDFYWNTPPSQIERTLNKPFRGVVSSACPAFMFQQYTTPFWLTASMLSSSSEANPASNR